MREMMTRYRKPLLAIGMSACFGLCKLLAATSEPDPKPQPWLRFRGENCAGQSPETGLLKSWPEGGPHMLWKLDGLGRGFSSMTIADGRPLHHGRP